MQEGAKAPLYEGANITRILVTGFDRLEIEQDIHTFVGTVGGEVAGHKERRVQIYIDATPSAVVDGLVLVLCKSAHLIVAAVKRRLAMLGIRAEVRMTSFETERTKGNETVH